MSEIGKMARTVAFMVLLIVLALNWYLVVVYAMFIFVWSAPFMVCHWLLSVLRREE